MRIYLSEKNKAAFRRTDPYVDIEPSIHGVNLLFSDPDGYCIARREEISKAEIVAAINEIISRPRNERHF